MFSWPASACGWVLRLQFCPASRLPARVGITDGIGSLEVFFTFPEVLPEMCQMIERVRVDPLLHCVCPLLVRDGDISNRPPNSPRQTFDHLSHCWSFADQRLSRRTVTPTIDTSLFS